MTVMKYEKEIVISGEPTTSSRIASCEEFVGFSSIIKSDDHRALGSDYR
jgi:hypothetical protein